MKDGFLCPQIRTKKRSLEFKKKRIYEGDGGRTRWRAGNTAIIEEMGKKWTCEINEKMGKVYCCWRSSLPTTISISFSIVHGEFGFSVFLLIAYQYLLISYAYLEGSDKFPLWKQLEFLLF